MPTRFIAPSLELAAFTCPRCETLCTQDPMTMHRKGHVFDAIQLRACVTCDHVSLWELHPESDEWAMVFPFSTPAPEPNEDMPDDVRRDYTEAALVVGRSPRAAAALLRLCIQKLCVHFGEKGKDMNADIKALVKNNRFNPVLLRAMDTVRISGNESVHPGELNLNDDPELALALFTFVNLIVQQAITEPRQVDEMYERMPEAKRDAVARRDGVPEPTA